MPQPQQNHTTQRNFRDGQHHFHNEHQREQVAAKERQEEGKDEKKNVEPTQRASGGQQQPSSPYPPGTVLTRNGTPDRRIRGQENMMPAYQYGIRSRMGGTDSRGRHFTVTGRADRRFKENANLTPHEAEIVGAEHLLEDEDRIKTRH